MWFSRNYKRREPIGTCYTAKNNFADFFEYSPCRTSKSSKLPPDDATLFPKHFFFHNQLPPSPLTHLLQPHTQLNLLPPVFPFSNCHAQSYGLEANILKTTKLIRDSPHGLVWSCSSQQHPFATYEMHEIQHWPTTACKERERERKRASERSKENEKCGETCWCSLKHVTPCRRSSVVQKMEK